MTDREHRKQIKRIRRLIRRWTPALGLGWWRIEHRYGRESIRPVSNGIATVAETSTEWAYRVAVVTWSMPEVALMPDAELEEAFLHEMMHVFVAQMCEGADHDVQAVHEEAVCTMLARAFGWTWRAASAGR